MEITTIKKPTIQELQNKRNTFKEKLDHVQTFWQFGLVSPCSNNNFLLCTYYQYLHNKTYEYFYTMKEYHSIVNERTLDFIRAVSDEKFFRGYNIDKLDRDNIKHFKGVRSKDNYSALGTATLAEHVFYIPKKEFIHKLLKLGLEPTPEDKELEFIEKWNRCEKIRQNIYLLSCAHTFEKEILSQTPKDIIDYILSLMFETEDSLFSKIIKKKNNDFDFGDAIIDF